MKGVIFMLVIKSTGTVVAVIVW